MLIIRKLTPIRQKQKKGIVDKPVPLRKREVGGTERRKKKKKPKTQVRGQEKW